MAGQQRAMEGDNEQRRRKAKQARDHGVAPSEAGVTTGASKQLKQGSNDDEHGKKLGMSHEGKANRDHTDEARPRSRPSRRDER